MVCPGGEWFQRFGSWCQLHGGGWGKKGSLACRVGMGSCVPPWEDSEGSGLRAVWIQKPSLKLGRGLGWGFEKSKCLLGV